MKAARQIIGGAVAALVLVLAGTATTEPTSRPASFEDRMKAEGRESWGEIDGHRDCWALVGDTSLITCRDGYKTTS